MRDRRELLKSLAALAFPGGAAGSPAGSLLAYVREGDLWLAPPDGGGRRRLTHTGRDSHPAWSRDGQLLAFLRRERPGDDDEFGQLHTIRPDGSHLRRLTDHLCTRPRWSPAADHIMVVGSPRPEQLRLLFLSPEGKSVREAIPVEKMLQPPPWGWMALSDVHSEGSLLSLRVMGHQTRDILIAEPFRNSLRRVYDLSHLPQLEEDEVSAFSWRPGHEEAAALSAPGLLALRRIGRENYTRTLWLCKPDGARVRPLYRSRVLNFHSLAWEPSGRTLAIESGAMLLSVDPDTGAVAKLWPGTQPAWAPRASAHSRDEAKLMGADRTKAALRTGS